MERVKADVVVLGTGGAGMASAITAAEGGAKVVVLEKRPFPGGASNTPVGFGFVKSDRESRDKAFKIHMEGTLWTANADLVRAFCDTSGEIPTWLTEMGVQADIPNQGIPMAVEPALGAGRFQAAVDTEGYCSLKAIGRGHGGAQLIKAMLARARKLGVDILFSTPGKKILRAGDRTTGVYAETRTGNNVHVDARAVSPTMPPDSEKGQP